MEITIDRCINYLEEGSVGSSVGSWVVVITSSSSSSSSELDFLHFFLFFLHFLSFFFLSFFFLSFFFFSFDFPPFSFFFFLGIGDLLTLIRFSLTNESVHLMQCDKIYGQIKQLSISLTLSLEIYVISRSSVSEIFHHNAMTGIQEYVVKKTLKIF